MTNQEILSPLRQLVRLLELHGANDFRVRSWQNAIQRLERLEQPLEGMTAEELQALEGVGKSVAAALGEIMTSGRLAQLEELLAATPEGLLELLRYRGLGGKRLHIFWKKFGVTDKYALRGLLESGRLLQEKGYGPKTVANLLAAVEFAIASEGKLLLPEAEEIAALLQEHLQRALPGVAVSPVGRLRRKWEVIEKIELLAAAGLAELGRVLEGPDWLRYDQKASGPFSWAGRLATPPHTEVVVYPATPETYVRQQLLLTGSPQHLAMPLAEGNFKQHLTSRNWESEAACYQAAGLPWCPPEIREGDWEVTACATGSLPDLLRESALTGIVHCHTTYSDGQHSLRQMAEACRQQGYRYLAVTDHSKAASFYANGMYEDRVRQQQEEIDRLNRELAPFRIFKGIEADILTDGALDYDDDTLGTFELVIASVHSGLNMNKTQATERLLRAIANPHTTILGHLTGRLLLQRQGYPVDHEAVINACAHYGVIIEINAHPRRLDLDWRWVRKALDKGVVLCISPDAHEIAGYADISYGVTAGRKGGLTAAQTFNAWPLEKVSKWLKERKKAT